MWYAYVIIHLNPILMFNEMRRLQQLLQARVILVDDVLYFTFKKHVFTGKVAQGGILWRCTWQRPGEAEAKTIFEPTEYNDVPFVRTFESLTDWTETCIQECLDEYHTRYSSWKRVRHKRSEQPMEALFKCLQKQTLHDGSADDSTNTILLFEQFATQRHRIETLTQELEKWRTWFAAKHPGVDLPVATLKAPAPTVPPPTSEEAQPFVVSSERGQYMVLHRLNEVAPPECVSWLKTMGKPTFDKLLQESRVTTFRPVVNGTDVWNPVDEDTAKRFIHSFFAKS